MKKNIKEQLLEIAKDKSYAIEYRGDLERRFSDQDDFIEVSVWSIEDMLMAAYELGRKSK